MTTLIDHPASLSTIAAEASTAPARRLRTTMAAIRVSFAWMGTQKPLTPEQKAQAEPFLGLPGNRG